MIKHTPNMHKTKCAYAIPFRIRNSILIVLIGKMYTGIAQFIRMI
jgi:hypothetical protein